MSTIGDWWASEEVCTHSSVMDVTALCKASKSDLDFEELHRNFRESKKHTTEGL